MATTAAKVDAARAKLEAVTARISAHPLNAAPMVEAREFAAEYRDSGMDAVNRALLERNLPSTSEQSKALLLGLASLARLNRRRIRLEARVAALEGRL